ncbi:hypothetical protein DO62_6176 [Burkholderia pseudomallei]|nr:hypothetical protein DO62_6176 [Burkholderia pseudomallei]
MSSTASVHVLPPSGVFFCASTPFCSSAAIISLQSRSARPPYSSCRQPAKSATHATSAARRAARRAPAAEIGRRSGFMITGSSSASRSRPSST